MHRQAETAVFLSPWGWRLVEARPERDIMQFII